MVCFAYVRKYMYEVWQEERFWEAEHRARRRAPRAARAEARRVLRHFATRTASFLQSLKVLVGDLAGGEGKRASGGAPCGARRGRAARRSVIPRRASIDR